MTDPPHDNEIRWTADDTFDLAGTEYVLDPFSIRIESEPTRFCLGKVRLVVDRYEAFFAAFAPKVIVEIGIMEGASTALFSDLARPEKLVAIDNREAPTAKLRDFISRRGYDGIVSVHGGVDQADGDRIAAILHEELGDAEIDLVVDDASHELHPTRQTFNLLFPRLRTGGMYLLEDWATGLKSGGPVAHPTEQPDLVTLALEAVTAKGRHPSVFGDITVRGGYAMFERGPGTIDAFFDVSSLASPS